MKEIATYTYNELAKLCHTEMAFSSECMSGRMRLSPEEAIPYFRINACLYWYVESGEMEITCLSDTYTVTMGTMFVYLPDTVVAVSCLSECKVCYMVVNLENLLLVQLMPPGVFLHLRKHPLLKLSTVRAARFLALHEIVSNTLDSKQRTEFDTDILRNCVCLFGDFICEEVIRSTIIRPLPVRQEDYFLRFLQLLSVNFRQKHTVSYYADELCITQKYLSRIIKEISGKNTLEWIHEYLLAEAENLLLHTTLTVSEVSYKLGFSNTSFFGKFFKKHKGVSPSCFRNET